VFGTLILSSLIILDNAYHDEMIMDIVNKCNYTAALISTSQKNYFCLQFGLVELVYK